MSKGADTTILAGMCSLGRCTDVMRSWLTFRYRSVAPDTSLSIWTKHIRGIEFHDAFQPQDCSTCDAVPAVTLGSGEDWGEIYEATDAQKVTVVGGTGDTIGLGGYLTGGGHSPLSAKYGLAVDQGQFRSLRQRCQLPQSITC